MPNEKEPAVPAADQVVSLPALRLDVEAYREYLADENLTEEQQRDLLNSVWLLVTGFVDLGFHLHPVQQALDVGKRRSTLAGDAHAMVSCAQEFNRKSNVKTAREAGSGDS